VFKKNLIVNYLFKYNYLLFLLISFLSLIGFLSANTSFGFVWDWSMPSNEFFLRSKLENNELYWNNSLYSGFNNNLNFELWFWRFIEIINVVSFGKGVFFSLFIFQILCFIGFYKIGKIYNKRYFLISLFYIYSYYAFSRLVAGHINLLLFYWSLPIMFVCLHYLYNKNLRETTVYQIILILVSLVALSHPISIFCYIILLIFFFFKEIINKKNKKNIFLIFFVTLIILLITQFHLTQTLFSFIFEGNNLFVNYREFQQVTNKVDSNNFLLKNILDARVVQHEQKSFGILFYIFTLIKSSMFYENVFSIDITFIKIIYFLSFIILISYCIIVSFQKVLNYKLNFIYLTFLLITFILICGSNNLLSKFFYNLVEYLFPSLFTIFANPLRFAQLFMIFLSLILLLNNNIYIKNIIFLITIISILQFFFFKFYIPGKYNQTTIQVNQILKKKINSEEIHALQKLSKDKDFYKIAILPPAFLSWSYSDNTNNFTIPWNSNYFSKSNLILSDNSILERFSNKYFFTIDNQDFNYNLLLKISNIKYLVVPSHERIYLYKDFIKNYKKNTFDGLQDYSEIFKLNLNTLSLKKSKISTNQIYFYEVENFYPEFYCPTKKIYYKNNYIDKEILKFSDNINDYYIFADTQKEIKLCKKKIELNIKSPRKNIYNVTTLSEIVINSLIFNNTYDKDWIIIPDKTYKTYLEIFNHLLNEKDNKGTKHLQVNLSSNYWDFNNNFNSFTIFNYNELKFYFIKIFQNLFILFYILINFTYFLKKRWKR